VEIRQVFITQSAQAIRDRFRIRDFGANEPERVNKRKIDKLLPLLAEVPKLKFTRVTFAKANGVIANKQLCAMGRPQTAANSTLAVCARRNAADQTRRQLELGEKTTQEIDRSLRCRIELDLFDLGEVPLVRDNDAVNRAVG